MVPAICLRGRLGKMSAMTKLKSTALHVPANSHTVVRAEVAVDTHTHFVEVDSRHSSVVV